MACVRCAELEEEVRQLKAELYNKAWEPPRELGLTRMQTAVASALMRSVDRPLSKEFLVEATRSPFCKKDDPEPKMIDTVICKMRERIKPWGLWIETVHGRGYRFTPATRQRLLNWSSQAEAA